MRYKLVTIDLDGTLLTSAEHISDRSVSILERFYNKGVHICIATGRMIRTASMFTARLQFPHTLAVCNGALVVERPSNNILSRNYLQPDNIRAILDCFRSLGLTDRMDVITDEVWYTRPMNELFLDQSRRFGFTPGEIDIDTPWDMSPIARNQHDAAKIMARLPGQDGRLLFEKITSHLTGYEITLSSPTLPEIMAPGVTKGRAMLDLAKRLGVHSSEVIAFGDQMNDMDMLQEAGTGVAMGNASDEVKNAADVVTKPHNEDGVAVFLESLLP